MFIKHTNYEVGVHKVFLSEQAEGLDMAEPFYGNVEVECRLEKTASQILLSCNVKAKARLACDRCNEEFDTEIKNEFTALYFFDKSKVTDDEDDVFYIAKDSDKLDISKIVRDYSYLGIPMKKLCKEDCKGLCPHCGANLNYEKCSCSVEAENPIWNKLKQIKFDE